MVINFYFPRQISQFPPWHLGPVAAQSYSLQDPANPAQSPGSISGPRRLARSASGTLVPSSATPESLQAAYSGRAHPNLWRGTNKCGSLGFSFLSTQERILMEK